MLQDDDIVIESNCVKAFFCGCDDAVYLTADEADTLGKRLIIAAQAARLLAGDEQIS